MGVPAHWPVVCWACPTPNPTRSIPRLTLLRPPRIFRLSPREASPSVPASLGCTLIFVGLPALRPPTSRQPSPSPARLSTAPWLFVIVDARRTNPTWDEKAANQIARKRHGATRSKTRDMRQSGAHNVRNGCRVETLGQKQWRARIRWRTAAQAACHSIAANALESATRPKAANPTYCADAVSSVGVAFPKVVRALQS